MPHPLSLSAITIRKKKDEDVSLQGFPQGEKVVFFVSPISGANGASRYVILVRRHASGILEHYRAL